jgi:hypothetical protein
VRPEHNLPGPSTTAPFEGANTLRRMTCHDCENGFFLSSPPVKTARTRSGSRKMVRWGGTGGEERKRVESAACSRLPQQAWCSGPALKGGLGDRPQSAILQKSVSHRSGWSAAAGGKRTSAGSYTGWCSSRTLPANCPATSPAIEPATERATTCETKPEELIHNDLSVRDTYN